MPQAVGSKTAQSYWAEATFGVTPASPTLKTFRGTMGAKFDLKRDTFVSNEMTATQQQLAMSYGTKSGSLNLPFEFSYGSFDDFMEALLGGTWASNVLKCGTTERSFGFEDKISEIGVYEQNLGCIITGMNLDVKSNQVITGSFDGMFREQRGVQTVGAPLAFDSSAKTITRATGSWIADGFAVGDIPLVTGAADAGNNVSTFPITALTATVMTLGAATGMVTKTSAVGATVALGSLGAAAAANTNTPFDSFTGTLSEGGNTIGYVTGLSLKLARDTQANFGLLATNADKAISITRGKFKLTGSLSVYFQDQTLKKKFLSGTASSLSFTLGDGTAKSYAFNMGTIKYTANSRDRNENAMIETAEFTALYDGTDLSTLKITRIPGA